jgi:hypothetical protein
MTKDNNKYIKKFNEQSDDNNWLTDWKVIDLLEVVKKIGGENWHNHPVQKEWEYQIIERNKGNNRGTLEWVGDNEKTPLINKFLLSQGFKKSDKVIYWISW